MNKPLTHNTHQQGVALIVVLLFLILIALAGAMAVRQSNTDLKTATADQINTLLLQSSDSANQRLEALVNDTSTSSSTAATYKAIMSKTGMFGYYLTDKAGTKGNEYIYCYNPRGTAYLIDNATIKTPSGGYISNNGECDYNATDDYTSSRKSVMTQVNMLSTETKAQSAASATVALSAVSVTDKPFDNLAEGKDTANGTSESTSFDVRTTSILPAFSAPTYNGENCLQKSSQPGADGKIPILTCLHNANTPSKMLYQQNKLVPVTTTVKCSEAGAVSTVASTCVS